MDSIRCGRKNYLKLIQPKTNLLGDIPLMTKDNDGIVKKYKKI